MRVLRFCGFVVVELVCILAIYAGALMRHWMVIEVGVVAAVIAYGFYSAADACCQMQMLDYLKGEEDGG